MQINSITKLRSTIKLKGAANEGEKSLMKVLFRFQVCAINAMIIILLGISMPSRVLQRALSYCFLIWSSLVILSKMIYQLRFVQADLFQHNCTDQVGSGSCCLLKSRFRCDFYDQTIASCRRPVTSRDEMESLSLCYDGGCANGNATN